MSLETEIKALREAVVKLTETMQQAVDPKSDTKVVEPKVEPKPEPKSEPKPEPKAEPKPKVKPKAEPVISDTDEVTEQSLQALCMEIVQADRSKGHEIKALLATYNEAKTIKQVNPDQYAELKAKLEDIKNG